VRGGGRGKCPGQVGRASVCVGKAEIRAVRQQLRPVTGEVAQHHLLQHTFDAMNTP
jgi:hypothetical protein